MVRIASLKLKYTARNIFSATRDAFKTALQHRFRDPRSDQFHYTQLQQAKQKPGKSTQDFADRCSSLARKLTPRVADPEAQNVYCEQAERMLLAMNTSGLRSNPRRQVRYLLPSTLEKAINIAVTVDQAEAHENRSEAFYLENEIETPLYKRCAPQN
jgi:hypothetical protein